MEFEEPPQVESPPDRAYWVGVVEKLKANPGKAGKTGPYSVGVANNIRLGKYVAFLPEPLQANRDWDLRFEYVSRHWEITARKADRRERQFVYLTWTGDGCGCRWCKG